MTPPEPAVMVRASPEILEQLAAGTVEPVVMLGIRQEPDGTYELILKAVDQDLTKLHRFEEALRTIRGPDGRGPWVDIYRQAGGGCEGLQAIANAALR